MTRARLDVLARATPELLERVCRVLRHRGATVERLRHELVDPGRARLDVLVALAGDVDLLTRQLARLPDVEQVRRFGTELGDHLGGESVTPRAARAARPTAPGRSGP